MIGVRTKVKAKGKSEARRISGAWPRRGAGWRNCGPRAGRVAPTDDWAAMRRHVGTTGRQEARSPSLVMSYSDVSCARDRWAQRSTTARDHGNLFFLSSPFSSLSCIASAACFVAARAAYAGIGKTTAELLGRFLSFSLLINYVGEMSGHPTSFATLSC